MPEYIEREALKKKLGDLHFPNYGYALIAVNEIPAADVVEVVHGEWIEKQIPLAWCDDDVDIAYQCSICGCNNYGESPYCPECGAKMDSADIRKDSDNKTTLTEDTKQTVLNNFMKGTEK